MDDSRRATPFDPTLDATPAEAQGPLASHHAVAIVEGSTPALSAETNNLLRDRLRIASLLLFTGFLAFFIKRLFQFDQVDRLDPLLKWSLFGSHAAVTFITGLIGVRLCTSCATIRRHVRLAEILVFGGSGVFFLLVSWATLAQTAPEGYVRSLAPAWLLLIFTYALFVPNTWRRAALVIGAMALAPIVLMTVYWFVSPEFVAVLRDNPHFHGFGLETAMILTLAAVIAVWGVHSIGVLRREVFEAKQLGQYRLKQRIGQGGMGEVYLAEHVLLKRPCAIKLIRPDKAGDARALARFEREVMATAKLTHWNTVEIFDYGRSDDGTFYYVMEYLPGLNLGQLVELHGPLPPDRVVHLLMQVCEALGEAHRHNLIHRDIKPGNIFSAIRGDVYDVAKLLDFGLAKPLVDVEDSAITQEGSITGSPLFMSPEQASGDIPPDARSDIYSLGAVAYYLLTGEPPFRGSNAMKVMIAHVSQSPTPPTTHDPSIPEDLNEIVMCCLEKDPDRRFQDTDSLRDALAHCHSAGTWTRQMARVWWEHHGCPQKRALDVSVLAASRL